MIAIGGVGLALGLASVGSDDDSDETPERCSVDAATFTAPGCRATFADTGADPDAERVWRSIDCAVDSRHQLIGDGGDPSATAGGAVQGDDSYRRLTVIDGDDVDGERCELGHNEHRQCCDPAPVIYREDQRSITFVSFRLPRTFSLTEDSWKIVMQMKQTQPSSGGGGNPVLALHASLGRWRLYQAASPGPTAREPRQLWSAPAENRVWTRFALDVTYSQDPAEGRIEIYADLNGDGDALDEGEQSPPIRTYTLKHEVSGEAGDGIAPGESIPSHLRVGPYQETTTSCPGPAGCSVDVDNIEVMSP
jgi:Polysaccharide lyase